MKSPLRMFRGMRINKEESKEVKRQRRPSTKSDELVQATQDMHEMRNCYDSLLSAAATTANNAHEFSEALEELGTCLLQKTALNDDDDSGRALMMMGKAQFELQKLFDSYRTHVLHTMDKPSRSLLSEIENVEEMKHLCDDRRETYRNILVASGGKGRLSHSQEKISTKELLEAKVNYEDEVAQFVFRIKSLKKGQFQSLLTQATRHHAAQLSFFRKGLKALEMVESQVRAVADRHHIDYSVSDLEDDSSDNDDDDDTYSSDDERLSFDCQRNFQEQNVVYISGNYKETFKSQSGMLKSNLRTPYSSQSAPIGANKKLDSAEKIETPAAVRKFHSYVLPTPHNDRNLNPSPHTAPFLETPTPCNDKNPNPSPHTTTPHPSPHTTLETKGSRSPKESEFSGATKSSRNSITTGNIIYSGPIRMPSDFSEKPSGPQFNRHEAYAANKLNRQAFSGPLTKQPFSNKPIASQYRHSTEFPHPVSLASQWMPTPKSSISPNAAPRTLPAVTSLKISELHELPRPPISSEKATGPSSFIGYSGPLVSRAKNNMMSSRPSSVHPLPKPLGQMNRSFSIPSNSQRIPVFAVSKLSGTPQNLVIIEEMTSPPPAHLPSTTMLPVSTTS